MEESLKGMLITVTIILVFITAILNFIILFPQEQGVTFTGASQNGYLKMVNNNDTGLSSSMNSLSNSSDNAFNTWDVTVGFMGSNSMKQSQKGVGSSVTQVFSSLRIIATELFTANSPIVWVIGIFSLLAGVVVVYQIYTFVRQGR